MKTKLKRYFALTDKGIDNIFVAARFSFLKFLSFMFPPMLVFFFLNDYIKGELKPLTMYILILTIINLDVNI